MVLRACKERGSCQELEFITFSLAVTLSLNGEIDDALFGFVAEVFGGVHKKDKTKVNGVPFVFFEVVVTHVNVIFL
jgi:hypothetical protein